MGLTEKSSSQEIDFSKNRYTGNPSVLAQIEVSETVKQLNKNCHTQKNTVEEMFTEQSEEKKAE